MTSEGPDRTGGRSAGRLGIFARTFRRQRPEQVAAAVARAFDAAGVGIPSVSATFNVIHPDAELRARRTAEAVRLVGLAPQLGAEVVTLCSGTRDPGDMWRPHPANQAPDAWTDLRRTLELLLDAATTAGVRLGVEPEPANVVRDGPTAARLLAELGGDAPAGIVLDPANLLSPETMDRQSEILTRAVALLGPRVVGVQLKDISPSGETAAPGTGLLDYPAVFRDLARLPKVPLIVQDTPEHEAARVRRDVSHWDARAGSRRP